ncbi:AAA family ATPase [Saccharicrinis sp. FJH54]|uniref:AAA family ATPase n=1 Tax=Saccharicrinis sp. FJH54 TaxID=3344665 RepID=UPI0035D4BE1F
MIEFINRGDIDKIRNYSKLEINPTRYLELKIIYEKLEFLCDKISNHGFKFHIRKDPRKQAGRGKFKFQEYHWAQIYFPDLYESCKNKFAMIIGIGDGLQFHIMGIKKYKDLKPSIEASNESWTEIPCDNSNFELVTKDFISFANKYRRLFIKKGAELGIDHCIYLNKLHNMDDIINLLEFKKQIILQGPPGTGKTYTAKDIAEKLIFGDISSNKEIQKTNLESSEQFNLIQFHPSYSYEDFVRGIVANSEDGKLKYETKNNFFIEFTQKSLDHLNTFIDGEKEYFKKEETYKNELESNQLFIKTKSWIDKRDCDANTKIQLSEFWIKRFVSHILNNTKNGSLKISNNIEIKEIYKDYSITLKYINNDKHEGVSIKNLKDCTENCILGKFQEADIEGHVTWNLFETLLEYYFDFINKETKNVISSIIKPSNERPVLKKYIIIVDEINRANLSSVLGELIYALEYRGSTVESMYELEGQGRTIIIPPNLYIIGTMNTADRSVGHIDYAIRRRFAFIDILPSEHVIEEVVSEKDGLRTKAKSLYEKVGELFHEKINKKDNASTYLASDFSPKEVKLGHSYFLAESEDQLKMKLEYEIKPILFEYVKDGILLESAVTKINELTL